MKKPLLLLALLACISLISMQAQEKWSVRSSFGTASGVNAVDGYYFSFDIGIPLVKSIEIAPTFNFVSTIPSNHIDNSWNSQFTDPLDSFEGSMDDKHYGGDLMGSASLLVLFKPLTLMNNPKLDKHELAIGTGIGFKSYSSSRSVYESIDGKYQVTEFGYETNQSIEPYYGKVFYNYHFTNKFFAGVVASLEGYDAEATALFGFQLGIRFSVKEE